MSASDQRKKLKAHWPPRARYNVVQVNLDEPEYRKLYLGAVYAKLSLTEYVRKLIRDTPEPGTEDVGLRGLDQDPKK